MLNLKVIDTLNFDFLASQWKAIIFVVLLFILLLTMAQFRHHLVDWSLKGAVFGIFIGFLLALILEGFLIISGKTFLTETLGWKNAPRPLQVVIEAGKIKLAEVLSVKSENPQLFVSEDLRPDDVIKLIQSLNPKEVKRVKSLLCEP
mgnify:CR=1 FL=1